MNFESFFSVKAECLSCFDDIINENFVLYKDTLTSKWKPCPYCSQCINHMIKTKWYDYIHQIDTADCAAALKRLLARGPPLNLRDQAIECDNGTSEIYMLYFNNAEQSAKLEGSLTGEERERWLSEQHTYASSLLMQEIV